MKRKNIWRKTQMSNTRTIGDYSVIKQIGQGSLGTVYLVEHRFMKRQYALKVLPEELSSDRSFIQRLEEEVGMLAALEHPNLVKIHNISFAQGQYFLVNDCIVDALGETTNLAQYLLGRDRRLEEIHLYRILQQIAEAITYLHSKKLGGKSFVHRSLKLNNILIGKGKGASTEVFLTDFGLSRIIGTGAVLTRIYSTVADALNVGFHSTISSKASLERYPNPSVDAMKLTPLHASFLQNFAFLAPEQKRLDSSIGVDTKADIYAFGVLAYYLLVGEFPDGLFDMPSSHFPDYEYDWDTLIRSCLQKDPTKRPESLLTILESVKQPIQKSVHAKLVLHDPQFTQKNCNQEIIPKEAINSESIRTIPAEEQKFFAEKNDSLKPVLHMAQLERPQTDLDPSIALQVDSTVKYYVPERKEVNNVLPILTDMVVVQGRPFYRGGNDGNRDEMPYHQISLKSFAIDIHPVTNEQFVRFLEVMGGEKDSNHLDIIRLRDSRIKRSNGKLSIESGYSKHPVVGVTWYGAIAYAKWIGKRLPTEAEWEIAARGRLENALYPTGEDIEKNEANFFSSDTTPVMSYAPNGFELYDMAGNVYEWCHDWYGYNYYEASVQEPENPIGPLQGVYRVLRGGCWKSLKEDLRCSRRHRNNPGTVNGTYGFRCAADVQ